MNKVMALAPHQEQSLELSIVEQVVMQGDLSKLNPTQRVLYYRKVCESSGLNPFTRPFDYIMLNGKLTLYAKKDATEQLRKLNGISIEKLEHKLVDDLYIVTASARSKDGRTDESIGAVTIGNLKGDAKANAIMKAETKAKRRVTLSISGMGWTDESEIESIPGAKSIEINLNTGEILENKESNKTINITPPANNAPPAPLKITAQQAYDLKMILEECDESFRNRVMSYVQKQCKSLDLADVTVDIYESIRLPAVQNMNANFARQKQNQELLIEA